MKKDDTLSKKVICCVVCGKEDGLKSCGNCSTTVYCSKTCQTSHWSHHAVYCTAISDLEKLEKEKRYNGKTVRQSQVDDLTRRRVLKLVGNKPNIRCLMDETDVVLLWDTGSMVSIVDREWLAKRFPDKQVLPVSSFLEGEKLKLSAANSSEIKFDGVVLMDFGMKKGKVEFSIPVLVSSSPMAQPILGFNVIEDLVMNGGSEEHKLLHSCFETACPFKIEPLVSLIQEKAVNPDFIAEVKSSADIVVPAGHKKQVRCRLKATGGEEEQAVYFSPKVSGDDELYFLETVSQLRRGRTNYVYVEVMNETCKNKVLKKGSVIGSVHSVSAVIPMVKSPDAGSFGVKVAGVHASVGTVAADDVDVNKDSDDWVPDVDLSHLDKGQRDAVMKVLVEEKDVFSRSECDIGDIKDFKMKIDLEDDIPVKEAYRRIPRNLYAEVQNYINDLLTNGWIQESYSSYSSPIVCVRKKDGGLRMCCDYRQLNGKTVADSQPIPRIQDILDGLAGKQWFSTLDMSKAYHQGYIHEDCRHLTAFATPWTLYEWIRIPFGLRNAPPAFQRFMNFLLGDMKGAICDPYLDDVLCYADDFKKGVVGLKKVLQRLRLKGIKLRADKCSFLKKEVRYLGRLVSGDGYRMDPADTEALERFREAPKNIGELRSLLGLFGYYRCYIKNFARKVKPLYDLLKKDEDSKEKGKTKKSPVKRQGQKYDAKEKIEWNEDLQGVVDGLIKHLKSGEVIAYPDFEKPFFMTCDASNYGLGAVLYQTQDNIDRVISYASRTLTDAERNYNLHSGKLEFLALKWAITERFADYLRHAPTKFVVFTDNNPLTYVLTSAKLNATGLRWVADLAEFNFTIKYRPGKENVDSDCLSRKPLELSELKKKCTESVEPSSVAAVMGNAIYVAGGKVTQVCHVDVSVCELSVSDEEVMHVGEEELIKEQESDDIIGPVIQYVVSGVKPNRAGWDELSRDSRILMRSFSKLKMVDGVLVRETAKYRQLVLPKKFHQVIYTELHEKMAHVGPEKVVDLAQQRFYWPRMSTDIEHYIKRKCRCIVTKKPNVPIRAPLVPIKATYPFQMVCIDFMELDKCQGGFQYVLVVVDHFTRFCQMYGTKSKSSQAAASKLWNEFIPRFGFPGKIHHDKGGEWNSALWKELHRYAGVKASNTTPYHPMGDGMVERLNRTAQNMLKAIPERMKKRWKDLLPKLAFAYNSTVNKSTGYSPFFLMFGRNSRLPVDAIFGLDPSPNVSMKRKSHKQFADEWKSSMEEAYKLANKNIGKAASYNKKHYDQKVHGIELKVGDQVLVRNVREKGGTGKLRSHWEKEVFQVVEKKADLPVYVIQNSSVKKDQRTVHRNLLMECNDLPENIFENEGRKKEDAVKEAAKKKVDEKKEISKKEAVVVKKKGDVNGRKKDVKKTGRKKEERSNMEERVIVESEIEEAEDPDFAVYLHEDVAESLRGGDVAEQPAGDEDSEGSVSEEVELVTSQEQEVDEHIADSADNEEGESDDAADTISEASDTVSDFADTISETSDVGSDGYDTASDVDDTGSDAEGDPVNGELDESNVSPQPQRKSSRASKPAKQFTIKTLGGPPELIDIVRPKR